MSRVQTDTHRNRARRARARRMKYAARVGRDFSPKIGWIPSEPRVRYLVRAEVVA